ncbi:hypothetical protein BJ944DRAFT_264241 [Cunninghamella echinulata]|nr:hypothetical protein BJ944DRAFT_264241 [Cunninghamella echinulata]
MDASKINRRTSWSIKTPYEEYKEKKKVTVDHDLLKVKNGNQSNITQTLCHSQFGSKTSSSSSPILNQPPSTTILDSTSDSQASTLHINEHFLPPSSSSSSLSSSCLIAKPSLNNNNKNASFSFLLQQTLTSAKKLTPRKSSNKNKNHIKPYITNPISQFHNDDLQDDDDEMSISVLTQNNNNNKSTHFEEIYSPKLKSFNEEEIASSVMKNSSLADFRFPKMDPIQVLENTTRF